MWRLVVFQERVVDLGEQKISNEQKLEFMDENPNNLLDIVRYLNECKTEYKTWYKLESSSSVPTTIYKMEAGK